MQTLTDGIVRLSPPTVADIPAIAAGCQDLDVQRWTAIPVPYSVEHAHGFVTEYAAGGWADWTARGEQADQEVVWAIDDGNGFAGVIGLKLEICRSAEVGYWLVPQARGRGVLHRALQLSLGWAFDDPTGPQLDRVVWRAAAGNWPSWRAAWRTGFRFEGQVRGGLIHRGERLDEWIGTLLADDPREPVEPWPATTVPPPHLAAPLPDHLRG